MGLIQYYPIRALNDANVLEILQRELTCPYLPTMHCYGAGLGFGLENKERSKKIKGTTKPLMANLDITGREKFSIFSTEIPYSNLPMYTGISILRKQLCPISDYGHAFT